MVAKKTASPPRLGDVVGLDFDPQVGMEQAGRRPALVLSASDYNRTVGLIVVCPVTNQAKGYPFEVAIPPGLKVAGVILSDHVKSVDWAGRNSTFICQCQNRSSPTCSPSFSHCLVNRSWSIEEGLIMLPSSFCW
jgi:mRNA interferase MazF